MIQTQRPPSVVVIPTRPAPVIPEQARIIEIEEFFQVAWHAFGWDEQDVTQLLKEWAVEYQPQEYKSIIIRMVIAFHQGWKPADKPAPDGWERFQEICPICGKKTIRRPDRNRLYGVWIGWDCIASSSHFFEWRMLPVIKAMEAKNERK